MADEPHDPWAVLARLRTLLERPAGQLDALIASVADAMDHVPPGPARLLRWLSDRLDEEESLCEHPYAAAVLLEAVSRARDALTAPADPADAIDALDVAWRSVLFSLGTPAEGAPDLIDRLAERVRAAPRDVAPQELEDAARSVPEAGRPLVAWAARTLAEHRDNPALPALAPLVGEALVAARDGDADQVLAFDEAARAIAQHVSVGALPFVDRLEDKRWPDEAPARIVQRLQGRIEAGDPTAGAELDAVAARVDPPDAALLRWARGWLDRVDAAEELPFIAPILGEALATVGARLEGTSLDASVPRFEDALTEFLTGVRTTTRLRLLAKRDPRARPAPPAPVAPASAGPLPASERAAHAEFLAEAEDLLAELQAGTEALEADPSTESALDRMARAAHTLKGTSAIFGYDVLCRLVHFLEDLVGSVRRRAAARTARDVARLRHALDELRIVLAGARRRLAAGALPSASSDEERAALDLTLARLAADEAAPRARAQVDVADEASPDAPAAVEVVRVNVARLDELSALVSELATTEASLSDEAVGATAASGGARGALRQLRRLVRAIERTTLSLRLVTLQAVFARVRRGVDQLVESTGHDVALSMQGAGVEVDRVVAQVLETALLHVVRNAVAHGLEPAAARAAAGKPPRGSLSIAARRRGEQVTVEVEDDGRGLDPSRLVRRAVELGMLRADEAAQLGPVEARQLVFRAGFSSREAADELAGRGVGLSTVVEALRRVGGSVDVESETGRWTRFTVRLRSNVALLDALLVAGGGVQLLVPVDAIVDAFPLRGRHELQRLGGAELLDVSGQLVRLVHLRSWAGEPDAAPARDACVVVLEHGAQRCALVVDRIVGERRVASTDVGPYLRSIDGYSAAGVLPDGRVGLVLDVPALIGGLS